MKRIKYPQRGTSGLTNLIGKYEVLFHENLHQMESDWCFWKQTHHVTTIPETVGQLLVADVDVIASVYDRFCALDIPSKTNNATTNKKVRTQAFKELDAIFKYTNRYADDIAVFFIENADELHISTCHYCEMAYVNSYMTPSPRIQPSMAKYKTRRHFDVDHFLPKSKCPIIGLSLFNFVPSCQVCNSRIKHSHLLGSNKVEWKKFNPAGENYSIDNDVKIRLRMWQYPDTKFKKKEDYYIYFRCTNGFRPVIDFFHLEERYEFHKVEALQLRQLKAKYPKSTIKRISSLLGKTEGEIHEDIFHEKYLTEKDRCFAKLTRDILQ